jgi:hypothetical protein
MIHDTGNLIQEPSVPELVRPESWNPEQTRFGSGPKVSIPSDPKGILSGSVPDRADLIHNPATLRRWYARFLAIHSVPDSGILVRRVPSAEPSVSRVWIRFRRPAPRVPSGSGSFRLLYRLVQLVSKFRQRFSLLLADLFRRFLSSINPNFNT